MNKDFTDATVEFVRGKHTTILRSVKYFIFSKSNQASYNFKPGPDFEMNSAGACLRAAEIAIRSLTDKRSARIAVKHFIRETTGEIRKEVCDYRMKPDECFRVNKGMTPETLIHMSAVFGRISKMANEEKDEGA